VTQTQLDIDVETFSDREKIITKRLREYRTIDRDIRAQQRIVSGAMTRCLPSLSPAPVPEDDIDILASLRTQEMTDGFRSMVQAVSKNVDMKNAKYANRHRVARRLRYTYSNDEKEDQALQYAYAILTERIDDEPVKLTGPEAFAQCRIGEVADAKEELVRLERVRDIIKTTLDDMQTYEHEWWTILWHKYVMREHWRRVCELAARNGSPLTTDEYRWSRRKALNKFNEWAVGLC